MATTNTLNPPARKRRPPTPSPAEHGLPDPRPVTDYTVAVSLVAGHTRVTVTLLQPCVVRAPAWGFIACDTGTRSFAASVTVVSSTSFYFDFSGVLNPAVNFIEPPYQDMQVQNFQGGFVAPGARWFRVPVVN